MFERNHESFAYRGYENEVVPWVVRTVARLTPPSSPTEALALHRARNRALRRHVLCEPHLECDATELGALAPAARVDVRHCAAEIDPVDLRLRLRL